MARGFFIYALSHPVTGELRYVGKTEGDPQIRFNHHMWRSRDPKRFSQHLYCWIRSLPEKPVIEVIEECAGHDELAEAEQFYIGYFRSLGFQLVNHTDGGEGCFGYRHTPEARAKMSAAKKGKSGSRLGQSPTRETRLLISRTKTGLTEVQQREIADAYRRVGSARRTAALFGVSERAVWSMVNIFGVTHRGYGPEPKKREVA